MSLPPAGSGAKRVRVSRVSVALLLAAVLISLIAGPTPHVVYRVPLALLTAWGLWHQWRWVYPVALFNGAVWLLMFLVVTPFLLVAPPWVLWLPWLYWLLPTGLVVAVCVLMTTAAARAERAKWASAG